MCDTCDLRFGDYVSVVFIEDSLVAVSRPDGDGVSAMHDCRAMSVNSPLVVTDGHSVGAMGIYSPMAVGGDSVIDADLFEPHEGKTRSLGAFTFRVRVKSLNLSVTDGCITVTASRMGQS